MKRKPTKVANVIPFRPREEVPRAMERFRSAPAEFSCMELIPLRLDPSITVTRLLKAMCHAGLTYKFDERLNVIVVMPVSAQRETSR